MKILNVIASMDPSSGGTSQAIRNSSQALLLKGVANEAVCLDDPSSSFLGSDPFPIHALGPASNPWRYTSKLIPWLRENHKQYDAIIVHGLWLYPTFAVQAFAKELNSSKNLNGRRDVLSWFVMPHGMLDPYFQKAPDRKVKAMRNFVYWKLIESKVIHRSDGILFTCQEELELAKLSFRPYHPRKEINVGFGIQPPPGFKPAMIQAFLEKVDLLKDQPFLLFLSRIHPKKGVDLLLHAYVQIIKESKVNGAEVPFLVIAGPGMDTEYGKSLKSHAESDPEMMERVIFTGMLEGDVKWGAFYGCDAFVLPSHQENFGIAVAEALACGKPVLISDKVNIWREIDQNNAGIVASDDLQGTEELLRNWQRLTADEKTKMAKCARTAYESHFRIEANIKALIEVLSKS